MSSEKITFNSHAKLFTATSICAKSYPTQVTHATTYHAVASESFALRITRAIPVDATQQLIKTETLSKVPFVRTHS